MQIEPNNKFTMRVVPIVATVLILSVILGIIWYASRNTDTLLGNNEPLGEATGLVHFSSDAEFVAYMKDSADMQELSVGARSLGAETATADSSAAYGSKDSVNAPQATSGVDANTSTTNVQVAGIDEPDMVKTDGERLYVKASYPYILYSEPAVLGTPEAISARDISVDDSDTKLVDPSILPNPQPEEYKNETSVVQAVPAESMKLWPGIEPSGDMLFDDETLVILGDTGVTAYSTPTGAAPQKLWNVEYANGYYTNARLYNGSVYLVVQQYVDSTSPCPFVLLRSTGGEDVTMPCTDILRPIEPIAANGSTSIMKLDLATGEVQAKQTVMTNSGSTTVAMFQDKVFLVQGQYSNEFELMQEMIDTQLGDLFPAEVRDRIDQVMAFDISSQSKSTEIYLAFNKYVSTLDDAGQEELQKQLTDRVTTYVNDHKRELQASIVTALNTDDLAITGTTTVPGIVLNQFSIDYHNEYLRMFTTVSASTGFLSVWPNVETSNDLYTFDNTLQRSGQVQDIAPGEQVYASRFMGDKAYLVTFKQVDPFFVFDLSNPSAPKELGQLKVPGYSSYLHQLSSTDDGAEKTVVMGVGQEGDAAKLSLFDATDAAVPTEISTLLIDASWTDVNYNHHAFLQDAKNKVVFIPANGNGYIISYDNNVLKEVAKVSDLNAQRAVYIGDVLYIVGTEKIVALKRGGDWAKLGEVKL